MSKHGKLIVLEGVDGSGKGTLATMLLREMEQRRMVARKISFPVYGSPGAAPLEQYLSGELGQDPEDTGAYAASTLYAVDRYLSYRTDWGHFLSSPEATLICDRYTTSNAVHQLTKLPRPEWDGFLSWLFDFEYHKLGLPEPDRVFFIDTPPSLARPLLTSRGRADDIHERSADHLERAYAAALYVADVCHWERIPNHNGASLRPIEDTFADLKDALGM